MPVNGQFDSTAERGFDLKVDISQSWFQLYASELTKYDGDDVNCEARLGHDLDNRVAFRNRQAWLDYVLENWTNVSETTIWQYKGAIRRASCHHRRHHIVLSIQAENFLKIEQVFQELSHRLSLASSPPNPYRYRRLSLEFEIGTWRPDLFVAGTKRIASLLGPDPDVTDAYAKTVEGEIEKLRPFFSLNEFCERIGTRLSQFNEIAIRMQARSIGIGIGVTPDHKKLRILTTLASDSQQVDLLHSAWPEELNLKQIKVQNEPGASVVPAPAPSENPWLKYGTPVLVAFITALSTAGLATGFINLEKAVRPDYKVTILSPTVNTSGVASWPGGAVTIDWDLEPVQASFQSLKKDVAGTVLVGGPSGPQEPIKSAPPVSVPVKEGTYDIVVSAGDANPAHFRVVVGKAP